MNWFTKMSISTRLGVIIGLVGLMLFGLTAERSINAFSQQATANRIVSLSLSSRQLLIMYFAGRIERGDNLYALLGEEPLKPTRQQTIAERRQKIVSEYDKSLALLSNLPAPGLAEPFANYKRTYQDVAVLRPIVD